MKNQGPELGGRLVAESVKTSEQHPPNHPPGATGEGHWHCIMSEGAAEARLTLPTGSSEGRNENWCNSMQVRLSRLLAKPAFLFPSPCPRPSHQPPTPIPPSPTPGSESPTLYSKLHPAA